MVIISKAVAEERGIDPTTTKSGRVMYIDKAQKPVRKPKEKKEVVKEVKGIKKTIKKKGKEETEFVETTESGCVKPKKRVGKKTKTGKKRCATKKPEE